MKKSSNAFEAATWLSLIGGVGSFLIGLFNASMPLSEKSFYVSVILLGLYSAISLQKAVRDRLDGLKVSSLYYGISWFALMAAIALASIGLWNATIASSEKGFFGIAFAMSIYSAIAIQKIVRDKEEYKEKYGESAED